MLDVALLFEFSRAHCIAVCAFLVPANLLATLTTMVLTGLQRPVRQVRLSIAIAAFVAGLMVLHVLTWFIIGVVMPPTYILLGLGCLCLAINLWALLSRGSMAQLLHSLVKICTRVDLPLSFDLLHERFAQRSIHRS
ncbi:hypothetical protein [Myxacorys almedinensis]|uniref:hypothetical protein n=1 Tax=Myxacorys almedinensis TaxID=2651157 RepID=UPI00192E91BA|nr:hypothetical protein [Myxacorys almedinensis]